MINEQVETTNTNQDDMLHLEGCASVHEVKVANLKKADRNKIRDFTFEYDGTKTYHMFISIRENPQFLRQCDKQISRYSRTSGYWPNIRPESSYKNLDFNFDYNKYLITINITSISHIDETLFTIPLNRELTSVSHSNKDTIDYFIRNKNIQTTPQSECDLKDFSIMLEHYYIIEVETRKPAEDTSTKEDGIQSVVFIILKDKKSLVEVFTKIHYSLFFIKQSLINYMSKYIYHIIYQFTHLPNAILLKFLANFGILFAGGNSQKIIFPLKQKIKAFTSLYYNNKIQHMNKNITNLKKGASLTTVPIHKFIQMSHKYDQYYAEKEFRIKQSILTRDNSFFYMKNSCIHDPKNDKITKEHKIDLRRTLTEFIQIINESLLSYVIAENIPTDTKTLNRFFLESLNKYLIQYISFNGFFNIDIVTNEDSMIELNCCQNKKAKNCVNMCAYSCLSRCLYYFNKIFEFNEGFFHKHFTVMDFSYNFNEKNVIHAFPSVYDSSKKSKVRIFDIPFSEKWSFMISGLILFIYRECHGLTMLSNENITSCNDAHSILKFYEMFGECVNVISTEFFDLYEPALPDYYLFCNRISKFPLDKYNCLDNLCQHFTNICVEHLIKNNVIFFSPYQIIYDFDKNNNQENQTQSKPNLNVVLEPYLILVDENLKQYMSSKLKKERFIESKKITLQRYIRQLKRINNSNIHYCIILGEGRSQIESSEMLGEKYSNECTEMSCETLTLAGDGELEKCEYDFYFLQNLSNYYVYKLGIEIKDKMVSFAILKRYTDTLESSLAMSFHDLDNTIFIGPPKKKSFYKKLGKDIRADIITKMKLIHKIQEMTQNMEYIFLQYVKSVIQHISRMGNSTSHTKNSYVKVGHYLINFNAYKEVSHADQLMESHFYHRLMNSK